MGCCISKCNPNIEFGENKKEEKDVINVQDKLVITNYHQPPKPQLQFSRKVNPTPFQAKENPISHSNISPRSLSISPSSSSVSSMTCTTSNNTISSLSSLSSVSSVPKEKSFSNEFLRSCYYENPHINRINSIRKASNFLKGTKPQNVEVNQSILQKRVRSISPNYDNSLTRQKSFRKEHERVVRSSSSLQSSRNLRSPSPSKRFSSIGESHLSNVSRNESFCTKRKSGSLSARQTSMSRNKMEVDSRSFSRNKETCISRITSKIDQIAVQEALSGQNEYVPIEDVNNPLISLDCFIFL